MSFDIYKKDNLLLVKYSPEGGAAFLYRQFKMDFDDGFFDADKKLIIKNDELFSANKFDYLKNQYTQNSMPETFTKSGFNLTKYNLSSKMLAPKFKPKKEAIFFIGALDGEYYHIPKYLVSGYGHSGYAKYDILIHKSVTISNKMFWHDSKNPFIEIIDSIIPDEQIIIGGPKENAIPADDYVKIISQLPTRHGYGLYARGIIQKLFSEYWDLKKDYVESYEKYLNKKIKGKKFRFMDEVREFEAQKYIFIFKRLTEMLEKAGDYSEGEWQKQILEIVLILFPQYSLALSEVRIKTPSGEDRRLDFAIVNHEGQLDLIEIKKPFENALVTKNPCRNNHVPMKELSTTVIQSEKYIYYLNKWGKAGEQFLTTEYKEQLDKNKIGRIKITSPKALLILGRDSNLTEDQKEDFHVIKRHYSNITDILTYDDLLRRLKSLIVGFSVTGLE